MRWQVTPEDHAFVTAVEDCSFAVEQFDHRAHLRLAYCYLSSSSADETIAKVRDTLTRLLAHNGVDPAKYHETLTQAWVLAVQHFMQQAPGSASAEDFLERSPALLDTSIMHTHYTPERLYSEDARLTPLSPDLSPIPLHA